MKRITQIYVFGLIAYVNNSIEHKAPAPYISENVAPISPKFLPGFSISHKESSSFRLVSRNKMMVTIADQKRREAGGMPAKYSTLPADLRNPHDLCEKKMNLPIGGIAAILRGVISERAFRS